LTTPPAAVAVAATAVASSSFFLLFLSTSFVSHIGLFPVSALFILVAFAGVVAVVGVGVAVAPAAFSVSALNFYCPASKLCLSYSCILNRFSCSSFSLNAFCEIIPRMSSAIWVYFMDSVMGCDQLRMGMGGF
jgi:hypothetical protein